MTIHYIDPSINTLIQKLKKVGILEAGLLALALTPIITPMAFFGNPVCWFGMWMTLSATEPQ
jgi:hypothetical protein